MKRFLAAVTIAALLAGEAAADETLDAEKAQRIEAVERGGEDAAGAAVDLVKIYLQEDNGEEAAYWLLRADELAPGSDDVKRLREILGDAEWMKALRMRIERIEDEKRKTEQELAATKERVARVAIAYTNLQATAEMRNEQYSKEMATAKKVLAARDAECKRLQKELAEKSREYEELTEAVEIEAPVQTSTSWSGVNGVGRGLLTVAMAPCNLLRSFAAMQEVEDQAVLFMLPITMAFETFPAIVDVVNGSLDIITFGAYGDNLYDDKTTWKWWERSNSMKEAKCLGLER